ncbi:MAG: isoleucine--tRNA ligase [Candidatus Heimdallarchaeota archaeon]|nr:isoleucine--tRNA ligase [Candidatus Heimdallarchaeota archaeon]MCK4769389.1 isoleucine--tRNA ligase [Candidatus Heimdallarchaeota archaeon]
MENKNQIFESVKALPVFTEEEEKILEFWEKKKIFDKARKLRHEGPLFRWLEGPPTANGLPHIGHALTRAIKDVFLRHKSMHGYNIVPWIAGWDCHGLPVELEVEKELGFTDKSQIEEFGLSKFNEACRKSVFKYVKEWHDMSKRIGFWLDLDNPYVTMEENYVESVWWSLKEIYNKGLMYKGHKVVPYCPRCGTPLSQAEVGQGMMETTDPSVHVKFKSLEFEDTYYLAWTTTPWTLISNVCLTLHPDVEYVQVEFNGEKLILAEAIAEELLVDYTVLQRFKGKDLEYNKYEQLFPFIVPEEEAFYVTLANYVTTEEGTGVVHSAPAFGEDDAEIGKKYGLPVMNPVLEDGTFSEDITDFSGLFVKKADPKIMKNLEERGLLFKKGTYKHTYPFCYRCDGPLLYYSTESWFIEMSKMRKQLVANNNKIRWQPVHLKEGRFGNFIKEARDWALSRNRFWGTPLPIWICSNDHRTVIGSLEELKTLYGKPLHDDFSLHRPWVDEITFKCPECDDICERVPYVVDPWYDSGSAPFAQYHYPFENKELYNEHFPYDFITEAIDQTRGWFYTLLAISTILFDKPAFMSCLTMGHTLDEKGKKMSKSKGNVIFTEDVISKYGADAVRWFLFSYPTWNSIRVDEKQIYETMKKFILTLWNSYSFFVSNSNVDQFDKEAFFVPLKERPELDKWLISEVNYLIEAVNKALENMTVHIAVEAFEKFVIDKFSNWYLRQSRRRFWKDELDLDKKSAYITTYEVLATMSKILAPFIPFISEQLFQNLVKRLNPDEPESIHLCMYPTFNKKQTDSELSKDMNAVLSLVTTGRSIRSSANIKLRQPLSELVIIAPIGKEKLIEKYNNVLKEELNVKKVTLQETSDELVNYQITPNFKVLAPKVKSEINNIGKHLSQLDPQIASDYVKLLSEGKDFTLKIDDKKYTMTSEDVKYKIEVLEGFTGEESEGYLLLFNTTITEELKREGYVRDVIRRIQTMRKELDLEYTQNIQLTIKADEFGSDAIEEFRDFIMSETLSSELREKQPTEGHVKEWEFDGYKVSIGIVPI